MSRIRLVLARPVPRWRPPLKASARGEFILKRCEKKRRLFAFLRGRRHELFNDDIQAELASMYRGTGAGKKPVALA